MRKQKHLHLPTNGSEVFAPENELQPNGKPFQIRQVQSHPVYAAMVDAKFLREKDGKKPWLPDYKR